MFKEICKVNETVIYIIYHQGKLPNPQSNIIQPMHHCHGGVSDYYTVPLLGYVNGARASDDIICNKDDVITQEFKPLDNEDK